MLNKEIEKKMEKYNKLRKQADELQSEIEDYLEEEYQISESDFIADAINPYSMDGVCPIYEWGERYFDIKQIKDIINFIDKYNKEVGENPEITEIIDHFSEKYNN